MCLCVGTATKLILSNKKGEKFPDFQAFGSLKNHTDNFLFCFGGCLVFCVFIYKSPKSVQNDRPAGYVK